MVETLNRGYQYDFSKNPAGMYDAVSRERKAGTMTAVLKDYAGQPIGEYRLLNIGCSTGIIDNYLANHFRSVVSMDIDRHAVEQAKKKFHKENLGFQVGDALDLQFADCTFDVVVCSQVYEHVPSASIMMDEILRVLVPGGICYFAASNRLMWNEPHYNLPLLSVIPRSLSHLYVRLAGKGEYYHELHYTYWGLRKLVRKFIIHDYTKKIVRDADKYHFEYMLPPRSLKAAMARVISGTFYWLMPGYIWLLEKPG